MNLHVPEIFKSSVVTEDYDFLWKPELVGHIPQVDTIVLSTNFEPASQDAQLLTKMMMACKLEQSQYYVMQLKQDDLVSWFQLREQTKATKVLLLGILPAQLGISAMMLPHEVNRFDGAQWMPTFALQELLKQDALRKHLWINVFQKVYFLKS